MKQRAAVLALAWGAMQKVYHAVPLDPVLGPYLGSHEVTASSDLDALMDVKEHYGPDVPFVLQEGERHVLTYKPIVRVKVRAAAQI